MGAVLGALLLLSLSPVPYSLFPLLMAQSGTGGTGASMACSGGEPSYCARDDRSIQQVTNFVPPAVNAPFVLPDFGERAVRVTDPNTNAATPNARYSGNSADYYNQWGLYDATLCGGQGGYRFVVLQESAGSLAYELCNKTMTVSQIAQLNFNEVGGQFSHTDPAAVFGIPTDSTQLEMYCYPDATSGDPLCAGKAGTYTTLYNFASCPNLPAPIEAHYADPPSQDSTDRYFSDVLGEGQNTWGYLLRWDRTTGNCLWFNMGSFQYGGTGIPATNASTTPFVGLLRTAPTVTPEYTTGTIPAGTYTVGVTYSGDFLQYGVGETLLSTTTTVILTGTGGFTVTPPSCADAFWCQADSQPGAQFQPIYSVYAMAGTSGTPTLQNYYQMGVGDGATKTFSGTISLTAYPSLCTAQDQVEGSGAWDYTAGDPWGAWGSGFLYYGYGAISGSVNCSTGTYSFTFATAPPTGHAVWIRWDSSNKPSASTPVATTIDTLVTNGPAATVLGGGVGVHGEDSNMTGQRLFFAPHGTLGDLGLFWNPANGNVVGCNLAYSCSGHLAFGFNKFIGVQNWLSFSDDAIFGNYNYGVSGFDTPTSYTSVLTGPPAGLAKMDNGTQHLGWNNDLNGDDNEPACQSSGPSGGGGLNALQPLDLENWCFSPVTGHIWRFFHTRSTGANFVGGQYGPNGSFWRLPFGTQSQDGNYALFSTDEFGELGFNDYADWSANAAETQGNERVDANGNLEVEAAASCTTGASIPAWPTTFNAVTTDNTCAWHLLGFYGQPNAGLNWEPKYLSSQGWYGGAYMAGVYIVDSNFNLEKELVANCYSSTTEPTWSTTPGIITQDNSCAWLESGPSGLTFIPSAVADRTDVFVVEMK